MVEILQIKQITKLIEISHTVSTKSTIFSEGTALRLNVTASFGLA